MYVNPIPRLEGKNFMVTLAFDFKEWVEPDEAQKSIIEYLNKNGFPEGSVSNITPIKEYK